MALASVILSNITNPLFTSVGTHAITVIYICNSGSVAVPFNIYAVPNGSAPSGNNIIYSAVPLTVNDTYVIDTEKLILNNGDSIHANLAVPAMTLTTRVVATISTIEV